MDHCKWRAKEQQQMRNCQKGVRVSLFFFVIIIAIYVHAALASTRDTIDRTVPIRDGGTGLISAGGRFELGFFSPGQGSSKKRYVGIWFRNIPSGNVVWVANRKLPLNSSTGVLQLVESGNLVVEDSAGVAVWQSSAETRLVSNPVAQLLDTGNLVIKDGDVPSTSASDYLWQSFDEPGDTLISGMKLGLNRSRGVYTQLTSWTSDDNPSPGKYRYRMEPGLLPSMTLLEGTTVIYNTGFWNGRFYSGIPDMLFVRSYQIIFVSEKDGYYFSFEEMNNSDTITKVVVKHGGSVTRQGWNAQTSTWVDLLTGPGDECGVFGFCGLNSVCNRSTTPFCQCPRGFHPVTSGGCTREEKLQCGGGDGFLTLRKVKFPAARNMMLFRGMDLDVCRRNCLSNCSCTAYGGTEIPGGGRGCLSWFGDLVDIKTIANGPEELYLRVPAALSDTEVPINIDMRKSMRSRVAVVVAAAMASGLALLGLLCPVGLWIRKRKKQKKKTLTTSTATFDSPGMGKQVSLNLSDVGEELPLFELETIALATNNFSPSNKIGEGGFAAVYKGVLEDGQEVAVKRLSFTSVHRKDEFINEVKLIAKLQHKNLVSLIGFCVQGDERILIYEYMKNNSLDSFIFDDSKRNLLEWNTRLDIILGIAKGLMYLHHDSRYKIIHRDLKAGNVLLDGDMNPKIADFGTARIFQTDQNMEKTRRVIGTHGYMAPEYAIGGTISVKSDVFSFGVLTLEVLSGAKSWEMVETDQLSLPSYAWKLWQEGNCLGFLDGTLSTSPINMDEILRCIQIALLCVQERAPDRPTMSTVVMMLSNENFLLPQPKSPGFFISASHGTHLSSNRQDITKNELTITVEDGR